MTDRNELERLLAAATEGPWRQGVVLDTPTTRRFGPDKLKAAKDFEARRVFCRFDDGDQGRSRFLIADAVSRDDAALIVWLRNNAQHYLSLMDEVERLRGEVKRLEALSADHFRNSQRLARELALTALANEQASSDWIDGFEFAGKRALKAIRSENDGHG